MSTSFDAAVVGAGTACVATALRPRPRLPALARDRFDDAEEER